MVNHGKRRDSNATRLVLTAAALALSTSLACHAPAVGGPTSGSATPDLGIGAAQFPDDDAIVLRWEQQWILEKAGTVHRRDHQWIKLLNGRPIGRVADPRIDFVNGRDELIIHTARTHLPDGTVLPVPDYSFNIAGPDDVAGWPEYGNWQQQVVSFSGIQDDAVVELDYEVVTPAGVLPWVEADLRLNDFYPAVERVVAVTLPHGTSLSHKLDRAESEGGGVERQDADGTMTYRWTFRNLAAGRDEPQSKAWLQRCGRLRFTTCPSASTWVATILDPVKRAGHSDDGIRKFAESVVEDENNAAQRVRAIAKKLHDTFNLITSPKSMQSLACRDAAAVFGANYGNPLEAAALYLAALRSLGMDATAEVGVDSTVWDEQVPVSSAFAGVAITVNLPDGPMYVHPEHGTFENPGHWGRHLLFSADASGAMRKTYVQGRGEADPSDIQIAGKITLDDEGRATGELRFHLTGLFYDPQRLETGKAQKTLVSGLVDRVLAGFEVTGHSITTLSGDVLRATVSVAAKDPFKRYGDRFVLRFGEGPAFLGGVPMPLERSQRWTDVQLAGRLREEVDLRIELPEGWKPVIVPASPAPLKGNWGAATQTVKITDETVRLRRSVAVTAEVLTPTDFNELRRAVNGLRANESLVLMYEKAP